MGLRKDELKNIINSGWDERRLKLKARSVVDSALTKNWKLRRKAVDAGLLDPSAIQKHTFEKSTFQATSSNREFFREMKEKNPEWGTFLSTYDDHPTGDKWKRRRRLLD